MEGRLLFDTHCHLDDERFDGDREQVIQEFSQQGVCACVTCGSDAKTSHSSMELAEKHSVIYFSAGIHPHEAGKANEAAFEKVVALLKHSKAVAVGEIGLDYYYDFSPRDVQQVWFERQLDLAHTLSKPAILHVRESHGAVLNTLKGRRDRLPLGVMHCFSGSAEMAREYQQLGFYISFAGSLTFKNAARLREAAQAVDLDRLLIETDSPYLTPEPFRGKRNDPGKVQLVCALLAQLRGMTYEEMEALTYKNACALFGIPVKS